MPKNTEPKHTSTPEHLASGEEKAWLDMPEPEKMPVQERDSLKGLADIKKLKGMFGAKHAHHPSEHSREECDCELDPEGKPVCECGDEDCEGEECEVGS